MTTLTIASAKQKLALEQAIDTMNDVVTDMLQDAVHDLTHLPTHRFESAIQDVTSLRQQLAFTEAFKAALVNVPVGISVYLEPLEVGVIREGLQININSDEDNGTSIEEVVSSANIKRVILSTSFAWGAVNPDQLANELSRQAREALEGNSAAKDLLAALS